MSAYRVEQREAGLGVGVCVGVWRGFSEWRAVESDRTGGMSASDMKTKRTEQEQEDLKGSDFPLSSVSVT